MNLHPDTAPPNDLRIRQSGPVFLVEEVFSDPAAWSIEIIATFYTRQAAEGFLRQLLECAS